MVEEVVMVVIVVVVVVVVIVVVVLIVVCFALSGCRVVGLGTVTLRHEGSLGSNGSNCCSCSNCCLLRVVRFSGCQVVGISF